MGRNFIIFDDPSVNNLQKKIQTTWFEVPVFLNKYLFFFNKFDLGF